MSICCESTLSCVLPSPVHDDAMIIHRLVGVSSRNEVSGLIFHDLSTLFI